MGAATEINAEMVSLAAAIDKVFFYKHPIVHMESRKVIKHEMLARQMTSDRRIVSAFKLIQEINKYDKLAQLFDRRALLFACHRLQEEPHTVFAVNLSGASLNSPGFVQWVTKQLLRTKINPKQLCLEITEHFSLTGQAISNLKALRACGLLIALDDYGTGFNSLWQFIKADYDFLKMAGEFSKGLGQDSAKFQSAVLSVFTLARSLNIPLVCECVENENIERKLIQLRDAYPHLHGLVLLGQGYHYAYESPILAAPRR